MFKKSKSIYLSDYLSFSLEGLGILLSVALTLTMDEIKIYGTHKVIQTC